MRRVMPATDSASAVFCIRFYSARRQRITHSLLVVFIKNMVPHLISVMTPCQSFNLMLTLFPVFQRFLPRLPFLSLCFLCLPFLFLPLTTNLKRV